MSPSPILSHLLPELARELGAHLREVADLGRRTMDTEGVTFTGATANGLYGEATANGYAVEGAVGSTARHALFAHDGRSPGRWPPEAPVREWLARKKGLSGRELTQATFLVRRKIGRRGTRGTRFLERALERMQPELMPRLARAADRALEGIHVLPT